MYLLLLAIASSTLAQNITLDQCIEIGIRNNHGLQRTILEKDLDRPARLAAWGQFLPSLNVGYTIDQSSYRNETYVNPDGSVVTLPIISNGVEIPIQTGNSRDSRYYLQMQEIIFDGGRNLLNLKNVELASKIRDKQVDQATLELRNLITSAYCATVSSEQRLNLASEIITQRKRQLELAQVRFETGSVTKRDVMQAEVDLGRSISDSITAAFDFRNSIENLELLLGAEIEPNVTFSRFPPLFQPQWDADQLSENALLKRNDYRTLNLDTQLRENDYLAAKGEYLPNVYANFTHTRSQQSGKNVSFTLAPRNRYTSVELGLSWNLFNRFTRSVNVQEAKIAYRKTILNGDELARSIRKEVTTALDHLIALYQQAAVVDQNRRLAEETLKFEQERYRLGSGTVIELGAAHVSYIEARNDQISIQAEFYRALGELEQATGMILRNAQ